MPFYHKLGKIPHKRHTPFRKRDGTLYYEQVFGTIGFDGMSPISYHEQRPTQVKQIKKQDAIFDMEYGSYPFDVVGYNGYNYPYAFLIHDFEPLMIIENATKIVDETYYKSWLEKR